MKQYTFTKYTRGKEFISGYAVSEPKIIEARSLKKALKSFSGEGTFVTVQWVSKKGRDSTKSFNLPYVSRKERKGKI
tara:strand:- start:308 stop:538 length:231 start_codon:yes stop_codon:yes gene_type:complete